MEKVIDGLNLNLEEVSNETNDGSLGEAKFAYATFDLAVPSSYAKPNGKQIELKVKAYFKQKQEKYRYHIIYLAGGPGSDSSAAAALAFHLLKDRDDVIVYGADHRGLGGSSAFPVDFNDIFKPGFVPPFPIDDLTAENAVHDIYALQRVLKETSLYSSDSKMGLFGFSYGSLYGWNVISMFPNTFDFAHLGGLTNSRSYHEQSDHLGLSEHCELSPFCRKHFARSVDTALQKAIENIINVDHNECTKRFHRALNINKAQSRNRSFIWGEISLQLRSSIEGKNQVGSGANSAQVVASLIKATSDCLDPLEYIKLLENLTKKPTDAKNEKQSGNDRINLTVNSVIICDVYMNFEAMRIPSVEFFYPQRMHYDLKDASFINLKYYYDWLRLKALKTSNYKKSHFKPLKSTRTAIYFYGSRLDLVTAYNVGWKMYLDAKVKVKQWILFDNLGHDGHLNKALSLSFAKSFGESNVSDASIVAAVKHENDVTKLDWSFPAPFNLQWNQIPDASRDIAIRPFAPNFHSSTSKQEYSSFGPGEYTGMGLMYGKYLLIALLFFVSCGVFGLLATILYKVWFEEVSKKSTESPPRTPSQAADIERQTQS